MGSNQRSKAMEMTSMILGIASLALGYCGLIGMPIGGVAIILSYLSQGGQEGRGTKAKLGMWLGIAGIIVSIICTAVVLWQMIEQYGSLQNVWLQILSQAADMAGMSLEDFMDATGY